MPKRLVICCDGTWNTPDQEGEGGGPCPTNVTKVALEVAPVGRDGRPQCVFYIRGVGTTKGQRLRGGAFGVGLSRNVIGAYRAVVEAYEPGDELFFFGFSRGAYTARSTVGFIRNCGILTRENAYRIDEAYRLYRDARAHPQGLESRLFRQSFAHPVPDRPLICFLGVWDTVGALGIPVRGMGWLNRRWAFHDTGLSSWVGHAYQALAVDERRSAFRPALWTPDRGPDGTPLPRPEGQTLEQRWFAGVHCGVGGGYQDSSLSDIPLLWMVQRAAAHGLTFRDGAFARLAPGERVTDGRVRHSADAGGVLAESRTRFYRLTWPHHRPIGQTYPGTETVASTVRDRRDADPGYRPRELEAYLARPGRRFVRTPVDLAPDDLAPAGLAQARLAPAAG